MLADINLEKVLHGLDSPTWIWPIIISLIYVFKAIYKNRQEVTTIKPIKIQSFIDQLPATKGAYKPILVEQLFIHLFGKFISYPEINFFLASKKPTIFLSYYLQGRQCFRCRSDGSIRIPSKFSTHSKRLVAKYHRLFWYLISSSTGLFLLLNVNLVVAKPPLVWLVFGYLVTALFALAYLSLAGSVKIGFADHLIKEVNFNDGSQSTRAKAPPPAPHPTADTEKPEQRG